MPKRTAKAGTAKRVVPIDTSKLPRKQKRNGNGLHKRPWEPTARQWVMYEAVARGGSYRTVGAAFGVTHQAVGQTCAKIDDMIALQHMDKVRRTRARHVQQLEIIYGEAMAAWDKSKEVGITESTESEGVTQSDGSVVGTGVHKRKRQERHQCGNPTYLSEARSALADIRRVLAIDKNPKILETEGDQEEYRVAGKPLEQVLEEEIVKLQTSLTLTRERTLTEK